MKSIIAAALAVLLVAGPAAASGFGLEGVWSPRGATILHKHGFQTVGTVNATTLWWNGGARKCLAVTEDGDHFVSIERVPHEYCSNPGRWVRKV